MNENDYSNLANEYAEKGTYKLAIDFYTRAIEINPDKCEYYSKRAYSYLCLEQYEEAVSDYSKALELNTKQPDLTYYNRGLCYKALERHKEAIKDFTKAIELAPNQYKNYFDRGECYFFLNRLKEAISDYTTVIELSNDDLTTKSSAYFFRAFSYLFMKDTNTGCAVSDFTISYLYDNDKLAEIEEAISSVGNTNIIDEIHSAIEYANSLELTLDKKIEYIENKYIDKSVL